jgi:hypothetical protein
LKPLWFQTWNLSGDFLVLKYLLFHATLYRYTPGNMLVRRQPPKNGGKRSDGLGGLVRDLGADLGPLVGGGGWFWGSGGGGGLGSQGVQIVLLVGLYKLNLVLP